MIKFLKKLFLVETTYDNLIDGVYAHQYGSKEIKEQIKTRYLEKHTPEVTPLTDPLKFDPLNPPTDWMYDPYYEMWIKIK
jgi:hypothetical protein